MNRDELIHHLTEWQDRCLAVDIQWSAFAATTGSTIDSPLGNAVWQLLDAYTDAVARLLDLPDSGVPAFKHDLNWYAYENDFGHKGHEAGTDGDLRPIRTPEDLAWLIGLSQEVPDVTP